MPSNPENSHETAHELFLGRAIVTYAWQDAATSFRACIPVKAKAGPVPNAPAAIRNDCLWRKADIRLNAVVC